MPAAGEEVGAAKGEADAGAGLAANDVGEEEGGAVELRGDVGIRGQVGGAEKGGKEERVVVEGTGSVDVVELEALDVGGIQEGGGHWGDFMFTAPAN